MEIDVKKPTDWKEIASWVGALPVACLGAFLAEGLLDFGARLATAHDDSGQVIQTFYPFILHTAGTFALAGAFIFIGTLMTLRLAKATRFVFAAIPLIGILYMAYNLWPVNRESHWQVYLLFIAAPLFGVFAGVGWTAELVKE